MRKTDTHLFQGMQRDSSVSKQKAEFMWEAHNVRLTAREGDTLFSLTNERGTEEAVIRGDIENPAILGGYVGHCVIGDYLVVFTHDGGGEDYIFRLQKQDDKTFRIVCLTGYTYDGSAKTGYKSLDLGFSTEHPMQTLGVYENEKIQKVYWTDGINQPRVINIMKQELTGYEPGYNENSFDFVPAMALNDRLSVRKIISSSGSFKAGVVQYFISYYNKYGQESNISLQSSLIPTSFIDRAGDAEETIGNCFEITVENPDYENFEYMRIYSMFRSSLDNNDGVVCKRVADIRIKDIKTNVGYENPVLRTDMETRKLGDTAYFLVREDFSRGDEFYPDTYYEDFKKAVCIPGTATSIEAYVFTKSKYPELTIKVQEMDGGVKYVTWGDCTVIYVDTENDYIYGTDGSNAPMTLKVCDGISLVGNGNNATVKFVDNGAIGDDIDSTELLYVGGESIKAQTIEQKDGTMFFGNIDVTRPSVGTELKKRLRNTTLGVQDNEDWSAIRYVSTPLAINGDTYRWGSTLNAKASKKGNHALPGQDYDDSLPNVSAAGFKSREHYRLGVQFQYKTGKWSEPVFLDDKT